MANTMTRYTIFNTPIISPLLYGVALLILKVSGWRKEGQVPQDPKFVVVGAPHTSNWDLPLTVILAFAFRKRIFWMGKHSLFCWPFGPFFKWLGGIPVDRSKGQNAVVQCIRAFKENDEFILAIAPEGTRTKVKRWKTGFYYIAMGANVPILLGSLDYRRKVGAIGPLMTPTGDIEADMKVIREVLATVTPRHPHLVGEVTVSSQKK